jgi:hypothetical protein
MPLLGSSNFSTAITLTEGGPAAAPACGPPNGDSATTSIKTLTISEPYFNFGCAAFATWLCCPHEIKQNLVLSQFLCVKRWCWRCSASRRLSIKALSTNCVRKILRATNSPDPTFPHTHKISGDQSCTSVTLITALASEILTSRRSTQLMHIKKRCSQWETQIPFSSYSVEKKFKGT